MGWSTTPPRMVRLVDLAADGVFTADRTERLTDADFFAAERDADLTGEVLRDAGLVEAETDFANAGFTDRGFAETRFADRGFADAGLIDIFPPTVLLFTVLFLGLTVALRFAVLEALFLVLLTALFFAVLFLVLFTALFVLLLRDFMPERGLLTRWWGFWAGICEVLPIWRAKFLRAKLTHPSWTDGSFPTGGNSLVSCRKPYGKSTSSRCVQRIRSCCPTSVS